MTRPVNLKTKIFLDGGDPDETEAVINLLGFLDGQTTNPTLISKNPEVKARLNQGKKFSRSEITKFYRETVEKISNIIPQGSVSIEVYADRCHDGVEAMLQQGREMFSWIPNAHIKYPATEPGLIAAAQSIKQGLRINITLCFSQQQAAAVYSATIGAKPGDVFISPFIGRLDDVGENGLDLIKNIMRMYKSGDQHVKVLTASVRSMNHFLYAIKLGSDIITAPFITLKDWAEQGMPMPAADFSEPANNLKKIPYQELDLLKDWNSFNLAHKLTSQGIDHFSEDWNALIE